MPRPEVLRLPNGEALPLRTAVTSARAPHGAGSLASDLAPSSPRSAGSDAPSDQSFAHAAQVDRT